MSVVKFLTYNNAVPIAVSLMLLGAGGAFAATDPGAIYSSDQQVLSIDNTYIANKDLSTYSPQIQITSVTEDTDNYYVAYKFSTIDLSDSVWQDVTKDRTLTVSKAMLGQYRDLGVYVTQQLKENVDSELVRLRETQDIERKNVTQKAVATVYGGLVGKMLNASTETLPGYVPVVTEPDPSLAVAQNPQTPDGQTPAQQTSGNASLAIQILGNNPAQIPLHSSYSDLGAIATDQQNDVIRIETYLNGAKTTQVQIDTTATSTWIVKYVALDPNNNSVSAERTVIVYDPVTGPPVPASQVVNGSTPTTGSSGTGTQTTPDTGGTVTTTPADSGGAATSTQETASSTSAGNTESATSTPDSSTPLPGTATTSTDTSASTTSATTATTTAAQ
ncbi:DUF5011 domain-containing protein [Candidatus Kaiserbacteria bacterium]|nr:DUF5011 domain-containing protein [Candidatus Kaiserbacteria bacterium]